MKGGKLIKVIKQTDQIRVDVCFSYDNNGVKLEKRVGTTWNLTNTLAGLHNKDEVEEVVEAIHEQLKEMVEQISVKDILKEIRRRSI